MSVLKSKRGESELEFYHTATEIRAIAVRLVMNENIVPKRWRPVFTFPMVQKVNGLIDSITAANTIYPVNEHELEMRRDYQNAAIIKVEQILQHLQFMLETLQFSADKLQPITELLVKEAQLLRGWRKANSKIAQKLREKDKK